MASSPAGSSSTAEANLDSRLNGHHSRRQTIDAVEHTIDSGIEAVHKSFSWRNRKLTHASSLDWTQRKAPYHEYVHSLVAAGWNNLSDLDHYMKTAESQEGIIASVLDISTDFKQTRWPDMCNEIDLANFLSIQSRDGVQVRLCLVEYEKVPTPELIEVLGSSLKLDPRFFSWSIFSKGHVFTPSQRHRAPYVNLGFGILSSSQPRRTDAEKFKVMVYVQPDAQGTGWTGVVLFGSHTKHNVSPRALTPPPPFESPLPPPILLEPKSIRQLYIESLEFMDHTQAAQSPFYTMSNVFRLNCFCWNQIITAIREEDRLINGISDTSIGHTEEIKRSLALVQRSGSLGWAGRDEEVTQESCAALEEDFKHLVEQTDLLWQNREKMAAIRQRKSETRWNSLTNAFTYIFAPFTIMSGIYGMNVSEISGTNANPDIWQFFVAVAGLVALMIIVFSLSNWVHIQRKHGRTAGLKEILSSTFGHSS
ncbi:hypothetical protein G7Y89_g7706 [Cudoniella acicularis]|uniref:Uncharacterized protein n=1 Tax=Cudoniella acicularis TaxID=354080 RepID=A0A8H4W3J5_9HELO|nr:hypothetical protein G7Y89_g7706 [Cudoniella acicularis]